MMTMGRVRAVSCEVPNCGNDQVEEMTMVDVVANPVAGPRSRPPFVGGYEAPDLKAPTSNMLLFLHAQQTRTAGNRGLTGKLDTTKYQAFALTRLPVQHPSGTGSRIKSSILWP